MDFLLLPQDTETLAPVIEGASVAILTVLHEDQSFVRDQAVLLEGAIVLHNIPDISTAMAYLFGLLYALNIDYPKELNVHLRGHPEHNLLACGVSMLPALKVTQIKTCPVTTAVAKKVLYFSNCFNVSVLFSYLTITGQLVTFVIV